MGLFYSKESSNNYLDMLMHDTFQTHIRPDHKQGLCLIVMELLFHGDPLSNNGGHIIKSFRDYSNSRSKS